MTKPDANEGLEGTCFLQPGPPPQGLENTFKLKPRHPKKA